MYAIVSHSGSEEKVLAKLHTPVEAQEAISTWSDVIAEELSEGAAEDLLVILTVETLQ